jgi:hypothetical protein
MAGGEGPCGTQNEMGRLGDRETPSAIDRDISGSKSPGTGRRDVSGKFKLAKHTLACLLCQFSKLRADCAAAATLEWGHRPSTIHIIPIGSAQRV